MISDLGGRLHLTQNHKNLFVQVTFEMSQAHFHFCFQSFSHLKIQSKRICILRTLFIGIWSKLYHEILFKSPTRVFLSLLTNIPVDMSLPPNQTLSESVQYTQTYFTVKLAILKVVVRSTSEYTSFSLFLMEPFNNSSSVFLNIIIRRYMSNKRSLSAG